MKDVMIDIETLGTRSNAAMVQIGACYFDRVTGQIGDTFEVNIKADTTFYTVDWNTVAWWLRQSEEARFSITEGGLYTHEAMQLLREFLDGAEYLWAHATFDLPIIQNAFERSGLKNPVPFRGMRDLRTLMDLAQVHTKKERTGVHHTALDDAKFQVMYAVEAMNKIKV